MVRALIGNKINSIECGASFAICLGNDIVNLGTFSEYENPRKRTENSFHG